MHFEHIDWKPNYELGIEDIDYQHHFFINLINRLSDELAATDSPEYRTAIVSELSAYARFHFISEENMMSRAGYPEIDAHKRHHRELLDQLSIKQTRLEMRQSEQEQQAILDFLVQWFFEHTTREDRLFADYLHRQGQS